MSTHNICFHGEIRKIFTGYPPLSRLMMATLLANSRDPAASDLGLQFANYPSEGLQTTMG